MKKFDTPEISLLNLDPIPSVVAVNDSIPDTGLTPEDSWDDL